jgi:predicted GIY-YIG superfamily endonuclease
MSRRSGVAAKVDRHLIEIRTCSAKVNRYFCSRTPKRSENLPTIVQSYVEPHRKSAAFWWFASCTPLGVIHDEMRFVYILRSGADATRHYVGLTSDVKHRLDGHNAGQNVSTAGGRPWRVIASIEFETAVGARAFERYLKSGSGRAFAKRHFP